MDILDLFGSQGESYDGALWLFSGMAGVWSPGGRHSTVEGVENALRSYVNIELIFDRRLRNDGMTKYAAKVAAAGENIAVVTRVENGDIVSQAPLPPDFDNGRR
jgi:hypothetical protein